MAKIENRPLPPINFGTTIREADRSAVYGVIGKELNSILNGADSYHPDGGRKDVQTSYEDLNAFIEDLQHLQGNVNDPSNILSSVLSDLGHIKKKLEGTMADEEQLDDAIRMKPEFAPNISDSNILHPDQFEDRGKAPVGPRNVGLQHAEARAQRRSLNSQSATFQGPNGQPVTDATGWQNGMFDSSLGPVQQTPRRLVSSQQQSNFDSSAVDRMPIDYGAGASATPLPSEDMSELLKLRSIIQAVGARGLFPMQ